MQNCIDKFLIQGILYMVRLKMEIKMSFFSLVHLPKQGSFFRYSPKYFLKADT